MTLDKLAEMGKISRDEGIMLFAFLVLLLLRADIPALFLGDSVTLNTTTSTFIGQSILLLSGVLIWDDVLAEKNAWDTLLWFGALIMMATQLNQTGLIDWFSTNIQNWITMMGIAWMEASALLVLTFLYTHYFFASTTAYITAMMAVFLTVGLTLGAPPMPFMLIMAATSSIMMTLTHYATGTSPVTFGSGYLRLGEWWKLLGHD